MSTSGTEVPTSSKKGYKYWQPQNVQPSKARWDSENTCHFLRACVVQQRKGNKGFLYLNNKGWDGVLEAFYNMTGYYYDQKQMKNRWDSLRKDYASWLYLKNPQNGCTGMGWDEAKKTVTAPDFWWDSMSQRNRNCLKFRDKGLEHEALLQDIFEGKTATGENQWTPSEDVTWPQQDRVVGNETAEEGFDEFGDIGIEELTLDGGTGGSTQNTGSGERVRRRTDAAGSGNYRKKRASQAATLNNAMNRVISAVESQGSEITIKQFADSNNATVQNCVAKLGQLPGITIGDPLYLLGTELMTSPANREVFMAIPTDEVRVAWLMRKHARDTGVTNPYPPSFPFPYPPPGNI